MSSSLGYPSVGHRVLDIPEIIEQILQYLDVKNNIRNAAVCKRWRDIALNLAWRHVSDIVLLFHALAPLVRVEPGDGNAYQTFNFARPLRASDWEHFRKFAFRVRSLTYGSHFGPIRRDLSVLAFDEVARNRPPFNVLPAILPHLQELEWLPHQFGRLEYSLMFMHDKMTKFTVELFKEDPYPIQSLFDEIRLRMPDLLHLDLRFVFSMRDIEDDAVALFGALTKLKKIILPVFTITSGVMEALSKLPNLGTVQFEYVDWQGKGDCNDVLPFAPRLEDGAFPSLWDLSLSTTIRDIATFTTADFAPTNITHLYIHVLDTASPSELNQFLIAISENCQLLTDLYITMTKYPAYTPEDIAPSGSGPTWETLKPLLSCPNLVHFQLVWDQPVKMTQENMEELAVKWPSLEVLYLNCEPLFPIEDSTLTLRALLPLARHCPKLRELGLYVSTDGHDLSTKDGSTVMPFKNLKVLNFGLSRISDPNPAALFLSEICPLGCDVVSGVTWPDDLSPSLESEEQTSDWPQHWEEVGKLLPILTTLRMEEGAKRKALEKEVGELRKQCRALAMSAIGHENAVTSGLGPNDSCILL
ncbi:unnamed protein product [Somion occarium]|uniref:F-box domain-containing protein n=1 Tax=Somion occarium TaxID=3059160 RepID=A0ABP1D7R2_9APHY